MFGHHAEFLVLHPQDLPGLALQHERAAGRTAHDLVAALGVRIEVPGQPPDVCPGRVEGAVRLQRQAAAFLPRDRDVVPVVFEHRHRHLPETRIEVVGVAVVEVDDGLLGGRGPVRAGPRLEGPASEDRQRGVLVDAGDDLDGLPDGPILEGPVDDGGDRRSQPARDRGPGNDLVPERDAALFPHGGAGLRVDLGDLHALRADLCADPATRAVVERIVRRVAVGTEPFGLRPNVFRPREQGRGVGERAERLADRALHAVVEGLPDQLHQAAPLRTDDAAAYPVDKLMPSPDFSCQGMAPASVAPAAKRFW